MTTGNKTDFYVQGPATLGSKVRDFFSKVFLFPNMKVQIKRHRVKDITKMET